MASGVRTASLLVSAGRVSQGGSYLHSLSTQLGCKIYVFYNLFIYFLCEFILCYLGLHSVENRHFAVVVRLALFTGCCANLKRVITALPQLLICDYLILCNGKDKTSRSLKPGEKKIALTVYKKHCTQCHTL